MTTNVAKFTEQQAAAITTRGVSIALSAGAGCGKTFVLTERFLAHLEPSDPDAPPPKLHELIAITFTDRAAREMRDRIRRKCFERLEKASEEDAGYWLGLLRGLDRARVSTIHSFCGSLLRANAVEARLDPRFTVVDQSQADTLMSEGIDDVLREQLVEQDERVLELVTHFGLDRLRTMIKSVFGEARSIDFGKWLSRSPSEVAQIWNEFYKRHVVPWALNHVATCEASRELLKVIKLVDSPEGELKTRCEVLADRLPSLHQSANPVADLEEIIAHARIQGVSAKKLWPNDSLKDRFKIAAEDLRAEAKWALGLLQFDAAAARRDAEAGLHLLSLVRVAHDRYEQRKTELAWLDFDDLLIRAQRLLTNPEHAALQKRLAAETRLLLVDECQDTDPLQVELIKAMCGPQLQKGKLFFVGDYKQSIYRFRGADPAVFRKLECDTPVNGRLPLSKNFRSQPAILAFVNALFHDVPLGGNDSSAATEGLPSSPDAGTLKYEPLVPHHPQLTPLPAIEFQWSIVADLKKTESGARHEARRREAEAIARRIRVMLDSKEKLVRDDSSRVPVLRPVEKRDIALLFRALSDVQQYEEALRQYDIDYYLVGGRAFYAQQEIYDVTNLLRTLASPADEVSLVGVLRSPMFSLTDETLFWLAEQRQGLAEGLHSRPLPAALSPEQRERAEFAAQTLRHLREIKDSVPIAGLLSEAFRLTGYDAALLGDFLGERKLANLRKLVEQARTFDQSGALGLADFIVQLSEFVARQPREPLAATHPEGTDVVRLMTIHQSKGLEFPVVFVPDICRTSFGRDDGAIWDQEMGPLVKVPPQPGEEARTTGIDLFRAISNVEEESERLRLLYVATTRAADFLVLSSGVFDLDAPDGPWMKLLARQFNVATGEFIGDSSKGYRPQVLVRTEPIETDFKPRDTYPWRRIETQLRHATELAKQMNASGKQTADVDRYVAPVPADRTVERRFSVSRFTGRLRPVADGLTLQADDEEPTVFVPGGAEFGTAVHKVLALVDYSAPSAVAALVDRSVERDTEAKVAEQVRELVEQFLGSPRGKELALAGKEIGRVHRELEFVLSWPPGGSRMHSSVYLQGFIDCLYRGGDGGWRLLDFKTNRVTAKKVPMAAEEYRLQMGVYALAVEQILGVAPSEIVVHFLRPGVEHCFSWSDEFRREIVDAVTREIEGLRKG